MSWAWRALLGPGLWALAFGLIYGAHGLGCALGWPGRELLGRDLHHIVLLCLWLLAMAVAALLVCRLPVEAGIVGQIVRAGNWIGLVAIALTLFPVLGLESCGGT